MQRLFLVVPLLASGCATTLSTMDTARTTPPGHVRAEAAMGVFVPAGPIGRLLDVGFDTADDLKAGKVTSLTAEQAEKVYEAAVATVVMPPAAVQEVALRTGIAENLDAGLRLSTTALRLDAKFRFLHVGEDRAPEDPKERARAPVGWPSNPGISHHMSVGASVSKYFFSSFVFDVLDYVQLGDFSRWDFEFPLLYTVEVKDFLTFYGGLKYVLTRFSMDENLVNISKLVASLANAPPPTDQVNSKTHFVGGTAGLGVGYRYVFLYLELTGGYTSCKPRLYSFIDGQLRERDLGGVTLYPALGLVVRL
jgi:hypothetical protein